MERRSKARGESKECKPLIPHFALCTPSLTRPDRPMCRPHGALSLKGEPMNNETSKPAPPPAASPLTAKPDLVKNIGGTTFDIHIHFSETSRETFQQGPFKKEPLSKGFFFITRSGRPFPAPTNQHSPPRRPGAKARFFGGGARAGTISGSKPRRYCLRPDRLHPL